MYPSFYFILFLAFIGPGDSQIIPCTKDQECPYDNYCYIRYCTPCFNCLKLNRKFNPSFLCPKRPEDCDECIEGYEVVPHTFNSGYLFCNPIKKGSDLEDLQIKNIFITMTIFFIIMSLCCVILRWEIRLILMKMMPGGCMKYNNLYEDNLPSAPPVDFCREEYSADSESNENPKGKKTSVNFEEINVELQNAKSKGNVQQSTMYHPPVYERNTNVQFSPGFTLGLPTSSQSAPSESELSDGNTRASHEEDSQQPPQTNDLHPHANSTSWQDHNIINFFNNQININQSVHQIVRFP